MRALLAHRSRTVARPEVCRAVRSLCGRARIGARRTGGRVTPEEPTVNPAEGDVRPHAPRLGELGPIVRPIEIAAIAGIIVVDQITKFAIRATIPLYAKRPIIPNLLDFTHVQNTGAAFGLMNAADFPYKSAVMIVIATLALVAISLYA